MSREQFVHVVTDGQAAAPAYFAFDAVRNREAHELLHEHERPAPLTIDAALEHHRRARCCSTPATPPRSRPAT